MKRRDFLRNTMPAATLLPAFINGYSVKAFGPSPIMNALMNMTTDTDHVLVIVQLSGGNDGLNMLIPLEYYDGYFKARSNVAIPQNQVLSLANNIKSGLHPAMTGLQQMYADGKASFIQSVGYPNPNFSHFRSTDIWMTGSDTEQVLTTGWAGRYLNNEYPNFPSGYPNATMPDPLGIQIGSISSLTFQGPSLNMAMSITNPTSFYNLVNGVADPAPGTPAGKELTYIRIIAQQTQQYGVTIKDAANNVTQQASYPSGNILADQLKIVARLVKGGLKTRVYMVSYGGFDNHSLQVNGNDPSTGNHANLLKTVSDALKAFQDDLSFLGIEDRVIGMTFSEFGRRIKSNSSLGTDHGAAAPMILFGSKVQSGVLGNNPTMPGSASVNDNIPHQYDFRSVYASILQDWFCSNPADLQTVLLKNFQALPVIQASGCASIDDLNEQAGDRLIYNYPNPFVESTSINFVTSGGHTLVQVIDTVGRVIKNVVDQEYAAGTYTTSFNGRGLPTGVYYLRLQNGSVQQVKPMLKVR